MSNALPTTDALLVIQVPYFLKQTRRKELWEEILRMKESGVVILDASTNVLVVPKDIEIQKRLSNNEVEKLYSDALDAFRNYASPDEIEKNENSDNKEGSEP